MTAITPRLNKLAAQAGVRWFDYQLEAFQWAEDLMAGTEDHDTARACYYYKTGAGKSITTLVTLALWGYTEALVITPPSTFKQWRALAAKLGMTVQCMSHAKFRMANTQVSRKMPIIADEFHLFGKHGGKGWTKLERTSRGLKAPLLIASATPNYNDAERVYCIHRILDPIGTKGGYLQWLYDHCITQVNPFSPTPEVVKFRHYDHAKDFLADLPLVHYVPDDLVYTIDEIDLITPSPPPEFYDYGYDIRRHRIIASVIENKHALVRYALLNEREVGVWDTVAEFLELVVGNATTPVLVFANHSTVAKAVQELCSKRGMASLLVTGDMSTKAKQDVIDYFLTGQVPMLIGTASLATGTDGLDKMCDTLVILDDTEDDSLRRQLIGRIMPRGDSADTSKKSVMRVRTYASP